MKELADYQKQQARIEGIEKAYFEENLRLKRDIDIIVGKKDSEISDLANKFIHMEQLLRDEKQKNLKQFTILESLKAQQQHQLDIIDR